MDNSIYNTKSSNIIQKVQKCGLQLQARIDQEIWGKMDVPKQAHSGCAIKKKEISMKSNKKKLSDTYMIRQNFYKALKSVENSIKAGRDKGAGLWHPHESLEGGTPTLGYGYKLTKQEIKDGIIELSDGALLKFDEGLSDREIDVLFDSSVKEAQDSVEYTWNLYQKRSVWEDLDLRYRLVMVNIAFNVGSLATNNIWRWPSLAKAIKNNDDTGVREEMLTSYYNPQEERRIHLTERRDQIADALEIY